VEPVHVVLEIERSSDTISGRLAVGSGAPSRFYGWLELIDRLERSVNPPGAEADADDDMDSEPRGTQRHTAAAGDAWTAGC
jgi:hypothetical protein